MPESFLNKGCIMSDNFDDFLKAMDKHCNSVEAISQALSNYAVSFQVTGNITMSKNLWELSDRLSSVQMFIRKEVYEDVDRQYKRSQEASANILNAALAGIEVATKEEK
jgi:hypothetical protein